MDRLLNKMRVWVRLDPWNRDATVQLDNGYLEITLRDGLGTPVIRQAVERVPWKMIDGVNIDEAGLRFRVMCERLAAIEQQKPLDESKG